MLLVVPYFLLLPPAARITTTNNKKKECQDICVPQFLPFSLYFLTPKLRVNAIKYALLDGQNDNLDK